MNFILPVLGKHCLLVEKCYSQFCRKQAVFRRIARTVGTLSEHKVIIFRVRAMGRRRER